MAKFQIREVFDTPASPQEVIRLVEQAFESTRVLGGHVENQGDVLLVRQICGGATGTAFWIYRNETTRVTAERNGTGVACLADVDYRPSQGWYSAVFLTGLISIFGWIQPVVMYQLQKRAVRKYIAEAFAEVSSKLRKTERASPNKAMDSHEQ
jgi:hypothetical protein